MNFISDIASIVRVGKNKVVDFFNQLISPKGEEIHPWYNLYENVAPHMEYPDGSIYDTVLDNVKEYPLNIAHTYYGKKTRYIKFNHQIIACAKGLKKIGVKKNDRVTICMANTPEAIITFYAINMIGGIANMIHPLSSEKEIEFYLNKSASKYVLCLDMVYPKMVEAIKNTNVERVIISKICNGMPIIMKILYYLTQKKTKVKYNSTFVTYGSIVRNGTTIIKTPYVSRNKNDDAVILYSGGTTGDPKGVVLSNLNVNALAKQSFKMTDPAKAGDSVLTVMPIFHGFGIGVCVHTCISNGMNTILIPAFKPQEFSKIIKKNKPSFLAGVPTMYEALINSKEKSKTYLNSVHTVICGGDILNEVLKDKVDAYLKEHGSEAKIRVGYGLSETTGASCLTPRHYFKEGGIGIPFPDTIYQINRIDTMEKADPDEIGEICIWGPTVMNRYLNDLSETRKVLKRHKDGRTWLHTGDLGYMTKDGLVFFKSRLKRMIVSSGYNIYPQYIEKVLMMHHAISTCIVVGIPHKYKVEVPKAYIVLKDDFENTEELRNDIKNHCEKRIAKYELPYEYEYVNDLPKTLVGKVAFTKLSEKDK